MDSLSRYYSEFDKKYPQNILIPYDWAIDYDGALKLVGKFHRIGYKIIGICPSGHECFRSRKSELEKYFYCSECYSDMDGEIDKRKGLYYPENSVELI
jgi:hypothetical protein